MYFASVQCQEPRAVDVDLSLPGTMTNSFFFVRSRSSLTSSSLSKPSTKLPAAFIKDQTILATSSALCIPLSLFPFVRPSGVVSREEAGGTLFGFAEDDLDMSPEVRTMAPLSRDMMMVLWTPGFWLRRVRRASVSSGWRFVRG
jgi:hypothetical protein